MPAEPGPITILLHRWREGDKDAEAQLFGAMMPELRYIAGRCLRAAGCERDQTTLLLNEALARLAAAKGVDWQDREHFLLLAARMMRRYVTDHARGRTMQFADSVGTFNSVPIQHTTGEGVVRLDRLLDELEVESQRMCSLVELKYFLGVPDAEVSQVLHIDPLGLEWEWHKARCWLFQRLSEDDWQSLSTTMNA